MRKSEERVSKQKSINKELVDDNAALIDKLKIAEDALDKVYKCIDNRYGVDASLLSKKIIADALAAIFRTDDPMRTDRLVQVAEFVGGTDGPTGEAL